MNSYFSHDSNACSDSKIIALRMKHKWDGYGLYWALIEKLSESKGYKLPADYNLLAYEFRTDASIIKSIINDFGLFVMAEAEDGKYFYSKSLLKRMEIKEEKSEKARKKAYRRWRKDESELYSDDATAIHEQSHSNANEEPEQYNGNTIVMHEQCNSNATALPQQCTGNAIKLNESKVNTKKESAYADQKEAGASSHPPSPEFLKFQKWLKEHAPYCSNGKNMKQITENELMRLKTKYTGKEVAEIIEKIENRKDQRKRYANLYRTTLNWLKKEYGIR